MMINSHTVQKLKSLIKSFLGSVTFYTTVPIPRDWVLEFEQIARWAPLIGLLLGGVLGLFDLIFDWLRMPLLTRSALIVSLWIFLTGGLHLDGVIDTADGLAVTDQERRLSVMKDSVTGAFGVMAAVIVILLKTTALSSIEEYRCLGIIASAGWGRWGQVGAIAFYPYLKPTGKGAFHKKTIHYQDLGWGLLLLLGFSGLALGVTSCRWWMTIAIALLGMAIALFVSWWFSRPLGGHTGDTYGAVVEWTEAILLCLLTCILRSE